MYTPCSSDYTLQNKKKAVYYHNNEPSTFCRYNYKSKIRRQHGIEQNNLWSSKGIGCSMTNMWKIGWFSFAWKWYYFMSHFGLIYLSTLFCLGAYLYVVLYVYTCRKKKKVIKNLFPDHGKSLIPHVIYLVSRFTDEEQMTYLTCMRFFIWFRYAIKIKIFSNLKREHL